MQLHSFFVIIQYAVLSTTSKLIFMCRINGAALKVGMMIFEDS